MVKKGFIYMYIICACVSKPKNKPKIALFFLGQPTKHSLQKIVSYIAMGSTHRGQPCLLTKMKVFVFSLLRVALSLVLNCS